MTDVTCKLQLSTQGDVRDTKCAAQLLPTLVFHLSLREVDHCSSGAVAEFAMLANESITEKKVRGTSCKVGGLKRGFIEMGSMETLAFVQEAERATDDNEFEAVSGCSRST